MKSVYSPTLPFCHNRPTQCASTFSYRIHSLSFLHWWPSAVLGPFRVWLLARSLRASIERLAPALNLHPTTYTHVCLHISSTPSISFLPLHDLTLDDPRSFSSFVSSRLLRSHFHKHISPYFLFYFSTQAPAVRARRALISLVPLLLILEKHS